MFDIGIKNTVFIIIITKIRTFVWMMYGAVKLNHLLCLVNDQCDIWQEECVLLIF